MAASRASRPRIASPMPPTAVRREAAAWPRSPMPSIIERAVSSALSRSRASRSTMADTSLREAVRISLRLSDRCARPRWRSISSRRPRNPEIAARSLASMERMRRARRATDAATAPMSSSLAGGDARRRAVPAPSSEARSATTRRSHSSRDMPDRRAAFCAASRVSSSTLPMLHDIPDFITLTPLPRSDVHQRPETPQDTCRPVGLKTENRRPSPACGRCFCQHGKQAVNRDPGTGGLW